MNVIYKSVTFWGKLPPDVVEIPMTLVNAQQRIAELCNIFQQLNGYTVDLKPKRMGAVITTEDYRLEITVVAK